MSKHLISRVIMLPDGTAHIALLDRQTVACTPVNLSELLSDPHGFIEKGQFNSQATTKAVNPKHNALEHIGGLTLLRIYSDAEIVCVFPKLFHSLFDSIGTASSDPLDLTDLVTSMDLSDEKHFLMKFFYDFTNEPRSTLCVQRKLGVDADIRNEIMQEAFNTIFMQVSPEEEASAPDRDDTRESLFSSPIEEDIFVSITEFARIHGVSYNTVLQWFNKGKLRGTKIENGKKLINKNTPPPEDQRRNRQMPPKAAQGIQKYLTAENNYDLHAATQAYIHDNQIVSPEVAEFIRTYEEVKYYERKNYHEVNWDGRRALIIDIHPDYVCKELGLSNRELILQGKSPRVPGKNNVEYHLHHIGQKADSPFAIIPGNIHLSKFHVFHSTLSTGIRREDEEDLHDENFTTHKRLFWKRYLEEYDKTGYFRDIPHTNLRHKKNGKKK